MGTATGASVDLATGAEVDAAIGTGCVCAIGIIVGVAAAEIHII